MPTKHNIARLRLIQLAGALIIGLFCQAGLAQGNALETARDLQAESLLATQRKLPLIVLYSRHDCKFCEIVRREHLVPMLQQARFKNRLIIRQINQDSDQGMVDFGGRPTTQAQFSASQKVGFVPVVAFYGANGESLAAPLVGLRLADFYQGYLDEATDKSIARLTAQPALKTSR